MMLTFEGARHVCHILEPAPAFTLRIGSAGFETSMRHGTSLHAVVTRNLIWGLAEKKQRDLYYHWLCMDSLDKHRTI
jgi:hypothetical protein